MCVCGGGGVKIKKRKEISGMSERYLLFSPFSFHSTNFYWMSALCQPLYKIPSFVGLQRAFTWASLSAPFCCLCSGPAGSPLEVPGDSELPGPLGPMRTVAAVTKALSKKDVQVLVGNMVKNNSISSKCDGPHTVQWWVLPACVIP